MSSSAKKKLVALGIALGALAIDRGLVFSGGSDASADAGLTPDAVAAGGSPESAGPQERPGAVAEKLDELREAVAAQEPDRDAFRLPEALARETEGSPMDAMMAMAEEPEIAAPEPQRPALPSFEVSSIITNSAGNKMAVINGVPIRLGQTRSGITLVDISSRTATIRYADQTVEVRLSE